MMKYPAVYDRMRWLGLNIRKISEQLNVPYTTLCQKLNGDIKMDVETALRVSKVLGKSVEDLFRYAYVEED